MTPQKVAALLMLEEHSSDHLVRLTQAEAEMWASLTRPSNNFHPNTVAAMLRVLDSRAPRFAGDEDNPNNGQRIHEIKVGVESSPVIYLRLTLYAIPSDSAVLMFLRYAHEAANQAAVDEWTVEYEPPALTALAGSTRTAAWWSANLADVLRLASQAPLREMGASLTIRMWWD